MTPQQNNKRSLEAFKIFPYIAWGLVIVFAFFVYHLTVNLQETADRLESQTILLKNSIENPSEIEIPE